MPQTVNFGFPLLADTPPEGMTGKDLRNMILGEAETSFANMVDAAIPKKISQLKNDSGYITKTEAEKIAGVKSWNDLIDKPFYERPRLESTELTFEKSHEELNSYASALQGKWDGILDERYKITWDGTEYTCTCKDFESEGIGLVGMLFMGNLTKFWGVGFGEDTKDTGEPFLIVISCQTGEQYGKAYIETTDTSETHTVSIIPVDGVKRLDVKYLPKGVATESYVTQMLKDMATKSYVTQMLAALLPDFSAADNGKVLGIKNGKLAWVTVQASGSSGDAYADGNVLVLDCDAYADGNVLVLDCDASVDGSTLILGG